MSTIVAQARKKLATLSFSRTAYTISPRGTRVYYALSYLPVEGVSSCTPTGSYNIERLAANMWVVTSKFGMTTSEQAIQRVGTFGTMATAKKCAQEDYTRWMNKRP